MQNPHYQSNTLETPETQATPLLTAVPAVCGAPAEPTLEEENLWDVWPYCWATTAWDLAQDRFHSFHKNLHEWRLARSNRRERENFQVEFWKAWHNRNEDEECELRLV